MNWKEGERHPQKQAIRALPLSSYPYFGGEYALSLSKASDNMLAALLSSADMNALHRRLLPLRLGELRDTSEPLRLLNDSTAIYRT